MSRDEWVPAIPDPRTITGSTMVEIVESTVIVEPCTVRLPEITTLSLISTCPPEESKIRLPEDVSTVLAEFPIRTVFAVTLPVPIISTLLNGL